jgi:hypothetical protein
MGIFGKRITQDIPVAGYRNFVPVAVIVTFLKEIVIVAPICVGNKLKLPIPV